MVTIPAVGIARVRTRVSVLPEGVVLPSSRKGTNSRRPTRNPQRVVSAKCRTVASTSGPPTGRGIDDYNNSVKKP